MAKLRSARILPRWLTRADMKDPRVERSAPLRGV